MARFPSPSAPREQVCDDELHEPESEAETNAREAWEETQWEAARDNYQDWRNDR